MRRLRDYEKVRRVTGWFLRNRQVQSLSERARSGEYLNAGCGPHVTPNFVNLDYRWVPGVDVVWDLMRPLPFPENRFKGIFTEHCLEHFFEADLVRILGEFHRVLRPGGLIRVVVPSLEIHARRYIAVLGSDAAEALKGARAINEVFYAGHDNMRRSGWGNDGHHFMHDRATLTECLTRCGFTGIEQKALGQGGDPALLIDLEARAWESIYVEARKPIAAPDRS